MVEVKTLADTYQTEPTQRTDKAHRRRTVFAGIQNKTALNNVDEAKKFLKNNGMALNNLCLLNVFGIDVNKEWIFDANKVVSKICICYFNMLFTAFIYSCLNSCVELTRKLGNIVM